MSTGKALHPYRTLLCTSLIALCLGSFYAFSVFVKPLGEAFGWHADQVNLVLPIYCWCDAVFMILVGKWIDRGYAKKVLLIGSFAYACCFMLTGFVRSLTGFYLVYGALLGATLGLGYGGIVGNTVRLFPEKKGLASGVVLASYGASSVLAAPLANALIEHYGVSNAYKILGLMFLCIILVCSFFIESAPVEQTGAKPKVVRHGDKNWRQMLGSKEFYLMFFLLAVGTLPGLMLTANASVIGQDMFQLTASTAAIYVSVYAVANCLGRLLWGALSDHVGRYRALFLICAISCLSLLFVTLWGSRYTFLSAMICVGLSYGGLWGVFPAIVSETFGLTYYSENYGVLFLSTSMSSYLGPKISTLVADTFHNDFTYAFLICVVFGAVAVGMTLLLRRERSRRQKVEQRAA